MAQKNISTPYDFWVLLKPKVMSLVVFTGWVGLFVAPGDLHPVLAITAILCIAVGSGASGAINMWYERDLDAKMSRTKNRPVPRKIIHPDEALMFGVFLSVGSVALMGVAVNWVAAGLLLAAILFYVFVYTIWLKRRTPQNIVIGGAAGAFPPMIGWAAVTGDVALLALFMFLIIFFWTPPHFWALALFKEGDYQKAGIPMLPNVAGRRMTQHQILFYSVILVCVAMAPLVMGLAGSVYGLIAAGLNILFLISSVQLWLKDTAAHAKRLFGFSVFYLFMLFAGFVLDKVM